MEQFGHPASLNTADMDIKRLWNTNCRISFWWKYSWTDPTTTQNLIMEVLGLLLL
jgi:hypothetical protein